MSKEQRAEDYLRSLREGLTDIGHKVNKMVEDVFTGEAIGIQAKFPADEYETQDQYILELEIPGVAKSQVNLQVIDSVLQVRVEKTQKEEGVLRYNRKERKFGAFTRSFPLPAYVVMENIKASFNEGVLTVVFPKLETQEAESTTEIDID